MQIDKSELGALTRVFSPAVIREIAEYGRSPLLARLLPETRVCAATGGTVADAFERAFLVLRTSGYRDEYVYRTAITHKILLGRHSLRTATVVNELRTGASKADMVVLNGTATAYEIKSDRDSLARLSGQVESYRRVFAAVNVVTSPTHARDVMNIIPDDVGVLVLSARYTLQTLRPVVVAPQRTQPRAVLGVVRVSEALEMLRFLGVDGPDVPNTRLRRVLGELFESLDAADVHAAMVATLRRSRSQRDATSFITAVPKSLQAAMLSARPDASSKQRIRQALSVPLPVALTWR